MMGTVTVMPEGEDGRYLMRLLGITNWREIDKDKILTIFDKVKSGDVKAKQLEYLAKVVPHFAQLAVQGLKSIEVISEQAGQSQKAALNNIETAINALKALALSQNDLAFSRECAGNIMKALDQNKTMNSENNWTWKSVLAASISIVVVALGAAAAASEA